MNKMLKAARKRADKALLGAVVAGSVYGGSAMAALDPSFQTNVDAVKTDVLAAIGIAVAAGLGIMVVALAWDVGFALVKKYTKKGAK